MHHIISREEQGGEVFVHVCWMRQDGRLFTSMELEREIYEKYPVMMRFFLIERGILDPYITLYDKIDKVYAVDPDTETVWVKYRGNDDKTTMRVCSKFLFVVRPDLRQLVPI